MGVDNFSRISVRQPCAKNPLDDELCDFLNGGFDSVFVGSIVYDKEKSVPVGGETHYFLELVSSKIHDSVAYYFKEKVDEVIGLHGPCGSTFSSPGGYIYYDVKTNEKYYSKSNDLATAWKEYKEMKNDFRKFGSKRPTLDWLFSGKKKR